MRPNLLQIRKLKELIKKNQISISDAVDNYTMILNEYSSNEFDFSDDFIILQSMSRFNSSIQSLLEDRELKRKRIANLNSILVLQELGVTFKKEELLILLKK